MLHRFNPNGADASTPTAALIMDGAGNLYGTSYGGGQYNVGTVFELSPAKGGLWTEKILYTFKPNGHDGTYPEGSLVLDPSGNLYGTTSQGGLYGGVGTVFELVHSNNGTWMEKIIHNFNSTDGANPASGLIFDAAGNLYGTAPNGGANYNGGTVFELSPIQGGGWTETTLYSFDPFNGTDGDGPQAGVVFDSVGNLYGTTFYGGTYLDGTVFELSPAGNGNWTEATLYSFTGGADGSIPEFAGVVFDNSGNLYGTTSAGGAYSFGTVFELSPTGGGNWSEQVLHSFNQNGTDGFDPLAGLVIDGAGNLYGTTYNGGANNFGTTFEVSPAGGGNWTEKVLHSFNFTDGAFLYGGLILDGAGNLYGAATGGGADSVGTAFELMPSGGGNWTAKVLRSFYFEGADGANPTAALLMDSAGNLYGTTQQGGKYDSGTVFEVTPSGTETILYSFGSGGTDGAVPLYGSLIMDSAGNLYGTTAAGGAYDSGTVFELSHVGTFWTERILHSFNGADGYEPFGGLVFDRFGNLYGTTYLGGGSNSYGTVFELMPTGGGNWTEQVLHSFHLDGTDGILPYAGLVFDGSGNLYGTTYEGGSNYAYGTVFELSPAGGGNWTEQVLHSFNYNGTDGAFPSSALVFDAAGNLYGTTIAGGTYGGGTVFELSRSGGGWAEQIPYNFGSPGDGSDPFAGVTLFGASANLYGTTATGGAYGAGTAFELTPTQGGQWLETVLHNFNPGAFDGGYPDGSLIFDSSGTHLFGTTDLGGGAYNSGTVFEIGP